MPAPAPVPHVPQAPVAPSPPPRPEGRTFGAGIEQVGAELAATLAKAKAQGRDDLVVRLEEAQRALAERDLPVVVAGEFKQGKSSLVNGLIKSEVCPVDDDIVTSVPTIVRYGPRPEAYVHLVPEPTDDGQPEPPEPAPLRIRLDDVGGYVKGDVGPGPGFRVRSVEVQLDRRVLRSGFSFVDCPGVGGLESAEGGVTLGVLGLAQAVLFVTDASQELTRAEVSFIRAALQRCPRLVCVLTKIDLYPEWRRIVALDEAHLANEGLHVPVVPVSSFLRLRAAATDDASLNQESRYPGLFDGLRRVVADAEMGRGGPVEAAAAEVVFATEQLRVELQAQSEAIAVAAARPADGAAVMHRLNQQAATTEALRSGSAAWQRTLRDGIDDLVDDVKHDLRDRLRKVLEEGEQVIERSDPRESWGEFEAWIRRQVVLSAVATYDYLSERAAELAERVGSQFTDDADSPLALSITAPIAALQSVQLGAIPSGRSGEGRSNMLLNAARGSYGGMLMLGMAVRLLGLAVPFFAPVAVLLSLGLGRKTLKDELTRRHQVRQSQAKAALRQYLDKVIFLVDKECRDALRHTQRLLRDELTARAQSLHRSSTRALAHAEEALALDAERRDERRRLVERELSELGDRSSLEVVGGMSGVGGGVGDSGGRSA